MDRSKQYRKNAADSLMLAQAATSSASQDYWRTMAEFWFRLAQHVEETEAVSAVDPSAFESRAHEKPRPEWRSRRGQAGIESHHDAQEAPSGIVPPASRGTTRDLNRPQKKTAGVSRQADFGALVASCSDR